MKIFKDIYVKRIEAGIVFCLCVAALTMLFAGCSKEVKRPSESVSIADEAVSLAESVRAAYVEKDAPSLEGLSTPEGFIEIKNALISSEVSELSFVPAMINIEGETVALRLKWNGTWKTPEGLKERRGVAVFELRGSPLKLYRVLEDSPFK